MNKRRRPFMFLLTVLGLVAASVVVLLLKPTVLGLDLKGGSELVLQGSALPGEPAVNKAAIDRTITVLRKRIDANGVAEPTIQSVNGDQIAIALPGVNDPALLASLVRPAQMFFYDYDPNLVGLGTTANPNGSARDLVLAARKLPPVASPRTTTPLYYLFATSGGRDIVAGPQASRSALLQAFDGKLPAGREVLALPAGYVLVREPADPNAGTAERFHLLFDRPGLTGKDLTGARQVFRSTLGNQEAAVSLQFTDAGGKKFQQITREEWQRGFLRKERQTFAIVLDNELVSNPFIDYTRNDLRDGISGGAEISGNMSTGEAKRLATNINSGAVPIGLTVIQKSRVSATLGPQSLHKALTAGIIGLVLVALFLIAYYRVLGVIAVGALGVYGVMFWAVIKLVPITMTLPGIAGMILTIGVAADASVVIFERIREEARLGRSAQSAIANGYRKGISAIIDANVVTLITAVIIYMLATGGPRGFAFTLFIGVLMSLFTAVLATRAVFGVLANTRLFANESMMGLKQREIRWKVDFVGKWRLWMAISIIPMVAGAVFIGVNGIKKGIDFTSGTRLTTSYAGPLPSEQKLRDVIEGAGFANPRVVKTSDVSTGTAGYVIETRTLQPIEQSKLELALAKAVGAKVDKEATVGPTFGAQIIRNAIVAIILSFIVIIVYLTLRFEYRLALPALLSVVHDVWLSLSIYSIVGYEVTGATVAALLTILGYSLYDVVIVFDRIRENAPLMRNYRYREVVNKSVHETLTRSIITSVLTLLPVAVLFLFGGSALKDFSFALLVGIFAGGISSILISAPIAALWKEREPAEKKRESRARRRVLRESGDADIVDSEALARAEAALDAEPIRFDPDGAFEGFDDAPIEVPEETNGTPTRGAPPALQPTPETVAVERPPESPGDAPERERRHRQVQRKRRR